MDKKYKIMKQKKKVKSKTGKYCYHNCVIQYCFYLQTNIINEWYCGYYRKKLKRGKLKIKKLSICLKENIWK